ncbi:hypothetical protein CYLTODRAFT_492309 [Cylindrobasidium torrendii FP15055 ss-10]|uniref:Fatty acid desaturase domain-containing protein n=1 Tax=Cylindrobasidium torrendii FP15055 ss-10 TaxID=1314674 RepID=A0A0D7B4I4_9AGAR|nr:hypothetical protein CYLTODRAFT_492309 [Cylindrobasidium torrendii FP15055 ss-10]
MKKDVVEQEKYLVPNFSVKDLLSTIPAHCFKRSIARSFSYVFWDLFVLGALWKTTSIADTYIDPSVIALPHPLLYPAARFALWAFYSFWAGLWGTGIWILAHECGHGAFSESKKLNTVVGWVLHSSLGVPYQAWRISHSKHHAATGHAALDQVYVPRTRSELGLPPHNPEREGGDLFGTHVVDEARQEFWEAVGITPLGTIFGMAKYLLIGWPAYLLFNSAGQHKYPSGTNHYNPSSAIFGPEHFSQIVWSDIGSALWLAAISAGIQEWGFMTVFRVYLVPYLWVNHWIIMITFLQHTDPWLPHYRAGAYTFPRGALSTVDRSLLGDFGGIMAWIGAHSTHGISETHILHHVCAKVPHYNAWEASEALKKKLTDAGINHLDGNPVGWKEMYHVFKECRFIEDEGTVVFYKNGYGEAKIRPVFKEEESASDSGVELDK